MSNEAFEKWLKENYLVDMSEFIVDEQERAYIKENNLLRKAWQASKADSEQEIAKWQCKALENGFAYAKLFKEFVELQAHINDLREALQKSLVALERANIEGLITDTIWIGNAETLFDFMGESLSKTPAQSLRQHDNEVIEKCAEVCDINRDLPAGYSAKEIRALKS